MVLAVIGSEELYGQVAKLNFRGDLDIRHIGPAAPAAAPKAQNFIENPNSVLKF